MLQQLEQAPITNARRSIRQMLELALGPFASLRLTVVLLALAMIVIFAGTWAQMDAGIWTIQKRYFYSFFCWIRLGLFLPRGQVSGTWAGLVEFLRPLGFPML